ncbi:putative intersectin-1-like [Trypanosoma conorhini]|uniref:Putative intersectin-1-like n=1 Tax=Trypanosoma conorhini TaxID=83891 RepID=A0A422P7T7_9TRYP|nr:putative intersectin-1-like [Trypanosoma conorhini]RNF13777.1 putative intersectin-1-like [Trypanosoma conorhini]
MEQCVALVDYEAADPDEISFRRGDVIAVTAKGSTSGFWEGFVAAPGRGPAATKEPRGLFPNCFVTSNLRRWEMPTFCDRALCLYDYAAADASEMSFRKGDRLRLARPSASPGWWFGVNESDAERAVGRRQEAAGEVAPAAASLTEPRLFPSNFVTCDIVRAAHSFEARHRHELRFEAGDVVQVHRRWNDGWWEGTLRGRRGVFPSNYTVPNVATTTPPFFCNACKTVFVEDPPRCRKCADGEEVTRCMLAALDDYAAGKLSEPDLFAYVEVGVAGVSAQGVGTAGA